VGPSSKVFTAAKHSRQNARGPGRAAKYDLGEGNTRVSFCELRRLRHRIEAVGGSKDQWEAGVWHMEKEQWDLLWTGEQAFWKALPHLIAAGHHTAEELTEPKRPSTGRPYKIPRLMAAQEGERTQIMRILLSRGIGGAMKGPEGLPSGGSILLTGGRRMSAAQDWELVGASKVIHKAGGRSQPATSSSPLGRAAGIKVWGA
jgi:hypothetical protein